MHSRGNLHETTTYVHEKTIITNIRQDDTDLFYDRLKLYLAGFKVCRTLFQSPAFHSSFIFLNHAKHLTHSAPINVWPKWLTACLFHPQYPIVPVSLYNQTSCHTSQSCHFSCPLTLPLPKSHHPIHLLQLMHNICRYCQFMSTTNYNLLGSRNTYLLT